MTETVTRKKKRSRGTGHLYKPQKSRYWWTQLTHNGQKHRQSTETTDHARAKEILNVRLGESATGSVYTPKTDRIAAKDLFDGYRRDLEIKKVKSLTMSTQRWNKHLSSFFGMKRIAYISTDLLNQYVQLRREQGAQDATINRELAIIRGMMYFGLRSTPPLVRHVPRFPNLPENNARQGFIEESDYDKLKQQCSELWLRTMIAIAYTVGMRKSELLGLKVKQVDLLGQQFRLGPGKNNKPRTAPILDEVYPLLVECVKGKQPDDYVLTRANGKPIRNFRKAWYRACIAAGLGKMVETANGKQTYEGLILHDFRRCAVRNLVRSGVPEKVAMEITGHKTRAIFDRYNIVNEADIADAGRKLTEYRRNGHTGTSAATPKQIEQVV